MTREEQQKLKEALVFTAELCGKSFSDEAIKMLAHDMNHMEFEPVIAAMARLRKRGKFPTVEEIEDIVKPKLDPADNAREVASLLIQAVSKFGWCNADGARKHMGELAWEIVRRLGGWVHLCETLNSANQGFLTAQIRDLATSMMKRAELGMTDVKPELIAPESPKLSNLIQIATKSVPIKEDSDGKQSRESN